jgi:hypothetical protein
MKKRRVYVKKTDKKGAEAKLRLDLSGEERLALMDRLWDDFWRINGKSEQGLRRIIRRIK